MDCEQASVRMYRFLDGELTVWRRWRITRHLKHCPPCVQGFDFEVELRQVVALRCREQIPPDLRARIAAALGVPDPERGDVGSGKSGEPGSYTRS
jgi:mycothiol system anti-sigma-R factor